MKILSITAQKPDTTGSGMVLSALVKTFHAQGHDQTVVGGIYPGDEPVFPEGVLFRPVYFTAEYPPKTARGCSLKSDIPYPIVGMSDEMPYRSTRYSDMTRDMIRQFEDGFLTVIRKAVDDFRPDLIICHHLYLLTAIVRQAFPHVKVFGFCHNTDLRQMKKNPLERARIAEGIRALDHIFVLRRDQIADVERLYGADPATTTPVGMGYNRDIFYLDRTAKPPDENGILHPTVNNAAVMRLIFAGKVAEKKGVMSLIRSLSYLKAILEEKSEKETPAAPSYSVELTCAGGAGNENEYREILRLAKNSPFKVTFTGHIDQPALAALYNRSDIFILPSFSEGLPLSVIEALACGCHVVISDLPGVGSWLHEFVKGGDIRLVALPRLVNTDEAVPEDLPAFEKRIAEATAESIEVRKKAPAIGDVSALTWERIAAIVLNYV